jgi:hypothetical protein
MLLSVKKVRMSKLLVVGIVLLSSCLLSAKVSAEWSSITTERYEYRVGELIRWYVRVLRDVRTAQVNVVYPDGTGGTIFLGALPAGTYTYQARANPPLGVVYLIFEVWDYFGYYDRSYTSYRVIGPITPLEDLFTLSVMPASLEVEPGGTATYVVSVASLGSFGGEVSLSVTGSPPLPAGKFYFAPPVVSLTPGGAASSTLSVTTDGFQTAQPYTLTVTGTAGPTVRTYTTQLKVRSVSTITVPRGSFTIAASPPSLSLRQGQTFVLVVNVNPSGSFNSPVELTVRSSSPDIVISLPVTSITPPGSAQVIVSVRDQTRGGIYSLVVAGTSGNLSQQAQVALVVEEKELFPPWIWLVAGVAGAALVSSIVTWMLTARRSRKADE